MSSRVRGARVRVNGVSPGPTTTPGTAAMGDGFAAIVSTIPLGRAADPNEIAETIVFPLVDRSPIVPGNEWTGVRDPYVSSRLDSFRARLVAQSSRMRSDIARRFAGVSRCAPSRRLDAGSLSFCAPLTLIGFDDAFAFPAVAGFVATVLAAARFRGVTDAISIPNSSDRSSLTSTFVPSRPVGFFFERRDPAFAIRPCWSTFRSVKSNSGR